MLDKNRNSSSSSLAASDNLRSKAVRWQGKTKQNRLGLSRGWVCLLWCPDLELNSCSTITSIKQAHISLCIGELFQAILGTTSNLKGMKVKKELSKWLLSWVLFCSLPCHFLSAGNEIYFGQSGRRHFFTQEHLFLFAFFHLQYYFESVSFNCSFSSRDLIWFIQKERQPLKSLESPRKSSTFQRRIRADKNDKSKRALVLSQTFSLLF